MINAANSLLFFKLCLFYRPRTQYHRTFNKDVILLTSPHDNVVVKQKKKQHLHEIGHILNAFEFDKAWDSTTVLKKIKEGFKEKVPLDVR